MSSDSHLSAIPLQTRLLLTEAPDLTSSTFRSHMGQLHVKHLLVMSSHHVPSVVSASCMCWYVLSHPAPRSGSLQLFSCRGSGCPGISLCSPASLSLLQRWTKERPHGIAAKRKEKKIAAGWFSPSLSYWSRLV